MKQICEKISPKPMKETAFCAKSNVYKLHFLETASGLKIVLTTDPSVGDLNEVLKYIFSKIYVEKVSKNPLVDRMKFFEHDLNSYIRSLVFFQSP